MSLRVTIEETSGSERAELHLQCGQGAVLVDLHLYATPTSTASALRAGPWSTALDALAGMLPVSAVRSAAIVACTETLRGLGQEVLAAPPGVRVEPPPGLPLVPRADFASWRDPGAPLWPSAMTPTPTPMSDIVSHLCGRIAAGVTPPSFAVARFESKHSAWIRSVWGYNRPLTDDDVEAVSQELRRRGH